jgi:hypothetical protein
MRIFEERAFDTRPEMLEQKSIVLDLTRKGLNPIGVQQDRFNTLGLDAASYSTIARPLRETSFPHRQLPAHEAAVELDPSSIDLEITQAIIWVRWSVGPEDMSSER